MSAQWRVLLTDRAWPDFEIEKAIFSEAGIELVEATATDEATLVELAKDVDAIGTNWAQVTRKVIESCSRCKIVSRFGIGLDNIAVDYATERKIPVTNVPDYCVVEVAEHTLALLLAAARNVAFFQVRTKQGEYDLQSGPAMRRLVGQTLGLVGLGRIGQAVAERARAFGLRVIAHTASGKARDPEVEMVSLEELLKQSDYVSLHAPSTPETKGMIGLAQLQLMKSTAWIINTSRGALIDTGSLRTALGQSLISGAALDVFSPEPPDLNDPLYRDERVIVTPHAAFVSEESVNELRHRAARQIVEGLQGERPENVVNPVVYESL